MTGDFLSLFFLKFFPQIKKKYNLDPGVKPQDDEGFFKFIFLEVFTHTQGSESKKKYDLDPGVKPQDDKDEELGGR